MNGPTEQSASARANRLLDADRSRRRRVLLSVSAAFALLSTASCIQVAALAAPRLTLIANAVAATGFVGVWLFTRRRPHDDPSAATTVLLGLMLSQHVLSAAESQQMSEVGIISAFSGLVPLIAAATLRVRGTVIATAAAVLSGFVVALISAARGFEVGEVWRGMGASQFFIMVSGTVAILSAMASRRAMQEQLEGQRLAEQAETERRAAEQRLQLIADQVSDLVAVLDASGHHIFVGAAYERLLGVAPGDMLGERRGDLIHPDDLEAMSAAFTRALGKRTEELVVRLKTGESDYRTFHLRLQAVDVDQRPHVALTARDITDLQALTNELESVRRMDALGRLAGGVAHDFNNLLSVIASSASMAGLRLPEDHMVQRDLASIDQAVTRAADLTNQLLAFARRQMLPVSQASPADVLLRTEPLLRRAAGPQVSLRLDAQGSWLSPLGESQIEQIVMNLVVNARDAMPEGGTIDVRVHNRTLDEGEVPHLPEGEYVVVEVQDEGTGMDDQTRGRIFEPFFSTKGAAGTGLGLATSFGIARQAGGNLTVTSSPGEGSTFQLFLPRRLSPGDSSEATTGASIRPDVRPSTSAQQRVLVVDDEQHIRQVVSELLRLAGMETKAAGDMETALALARSEAFDGILTDVVLGNEDGLEVLEKLRQLQPKARLVVMSGYTPSPARLTALQETGIRFLAKPFATRDLLEALGA